ncbi:hypothetical protein GW923_04480 [Candidatus Pacearchaeota archaeon]|nr:hypothetical protein [Candidatus Pacearchaeota archaeon]
MDWKSFSYGILAVLVLILAMASFGFAHIGKVGAFSGNAVSAIGTDSGNIPEKCRVPSGQDLGSWKEHLGHHAETQECLKYFD